MSIPGDEMREALGKAERDGGYHFDWRLTSSTITTLVKLVIPPNGVLPVVFVPGIMGSNLKSKGGGDQVWRLDAGIGGIPAKVAKRWATKGPGSRQSALHPARVEVDREGATPKKRVGSIADESDYKNRGWGEVAESSYHGFLAWLEAKLHDEGANPYYWRDFSFSEIRSSSPAPAPGQPGYRPPSLSSGMPMRMQDPPRGAEKGTYLQPVMSDDLINRANYRMPVYACGYNWLDSNEVAAERLRGRILEIIEENNRNGSWCKQVIVVTHSMGGLVARRCAMLEGMSEVVAGIVHGVMPAVGAAVAYRRCKIGMWDEDWKAGLAIGTDGRQTTAVFAQAPGALQLLPTKEYRRDWLKVLDGSGKPLEIQPNSDPYDDIYLRRDRWWGLVREEWLRPKDGTPIAWGDYANNVYIARSFHERISGNYHPVTYVYYGDDHEQKSFETVAWRMKFGLRPDDKTPSPERVSQMRFSDVRDDGSNPLYVGGKMETTPSLGMMETPIIYQSSYWELRCDLQDGSGDGTVPASSGRTPLEKGGDNVRQQFKLSGFGHEPSYKDHGAQRATLYSIVKIAGHAKARA